MAKEEQLGLGVLQCSNSIHTTHEVGFSIPTPLKFRLKRSGSLRHAWSRGVICTLYGSTATLSLIYRTQAQLLDNITPYLLRLTQESDQRRCSPVLLSYPNLLYTMSSRYIPPAQQRHMRACMVCSIVQTQTVSLGCFPAGFSHADLTH